MFVSFLLVLSRFCPFVFQGDRLILMIESEQKVFTDNNRNSDVKFRVMVWSVIVAILITTTVLVMNFLSNRISDGVIPVSDQPAVLSEEDRIRKIISVPVTVSKEEEARISATISRSDVEVSEEELQRIIETISGKGPAASEF